MTKGSIGLAERKSPLDPAPVSNALMALKLFGFF